MRLLQVAWLLTSNLRRGRAFDFWGGVWLISEENILQTDFEGRKYICKIIPAIQSLCRSGKKILSPRSLGKKFFPTQITHIRPPSKVKWSAPKVTRESRNPRAMCHFDVKQVCLELLKRTTYTDATTWFAGRQLWLVGDKMRNSAIQLVLEQCLKVRKASCIFLLALLTVVALPFPA